MTTKLRRAALALAAVCASVSLVYAANPTFWQVSNEAEFAKGDVENLSIDSYGRLTLGPTTTSIYDASAPFLWSMISAPDGATYVGSGNEGQVYKVDANGRGSVFFDSEELEVHALAPAPGGGIYAGTSPEGKIYKVDASGKSTMLFDPPDKYIWGLAVDKAGNVFAATGDKGVVYKITPDGKGTVFYQTKTTHAISLAIENDGHLLVGTESPGRLFRLDANGKPFVLLDSPYNEIHTLKLDPKGVIYAAAVSGPGGSNPSPSTSTSNSEPAAAPTPTVTVSTEITAIAVVDQAPQGGAATTSSADRSNTGSSAGGVYRITPDGAWDLIWSSREDSPFDVAIEPDGNVLVGTGNKGKIYRLSGDPLQPTLLTRATAQQVTALLRDNDGRVTFATSNPGKVLRLSPARAERGTYTSDVRDAQTIATWGAIRWQAAVAPGTRVEISTRSGNTRTPDETWSDWTAPYAMQEGSPISSPRARYLQWRAILTGSKSDAPLLTSVTAAYLPRNIRPEVVSITINPPGTVFQRPFPTGDPEIAGFDGDVPNRNTQQPGGGTGGPNVGRRVYQKGLLTFTWRAQDDNRDELTYDVFYRREGETAWKPLKKALSDEIVVWDTSSVPNGRYVIRVVASDAASNSPATALTGALESTAFDIDNTPPVITVTSVMRQGARLMIAFDVRDENSNVQKAEYSLDGDRWQTIYPKDGIPDSRLEQFELVLEGELGTHGVIIRATDALNNVASTRGDIVTPTPSTTPARSR